MPPAICVNDTEMETQAVLSGLGIGQLGSFNAAPHIRSGRLVPLLTQHVTEYRMLYLYYGHRTERPSRVKTFIDFMIERMAGNRNFFLDPSELRAAEPRGEGACLVHMRVEDGSTRGAHRPRFTGGCRSLHSVTG